MNDYDIQEAFKRIEDELIASMMRNMQMTPSRRNKRRYRMGMWQAEQLRALEEYRKRNAKNIMANLKKSIQAFLRLLANLENVGTLTRKHISSKRSGRHLAVQEISMEHSSRLMIVR